MAESGRSSRPLWLGGLLAVWTILVWGWVLRTGLWGWDVYPLIAAGRIEAPRDVLGTFGEELMDGRYPLGSYWRPLVHLSFGLDHALWGIDPFGYHLTDLALLVGCVLAIAYVARRWVSERSALVAAVVFGGNLIHDDVLAVPARRADSLALFFTLVALGAALSRGSRGRWLGALAVAAALASKESGAIAVLVVTGAAAAFTSGSLRDRGAHVAREAWPAWIAFGLTFGLRTWALGGIGGSREAAVSAAWSESLGSVARYFPAAFAPTQARIVGSTVISSAVAAVLVLLFVLVARRAALRTLLPLVLWFLALASLTAISRAERGWYEQPFVAINALFAAALLEHLLALGGRARVLALPVLAWAIVSIFPWRAGSNDVQAAGETARGYLAKVEDTLRGASQGSAVRAAGLPMERGDSRPWLDGRERNFAILAPYSVAAFVELAWPDRKVRVVPPAAPTLPTAEEVVLVLER